MDNNSIIEGTVKFRDGKKWKSRWCVMRKLSPVADCLHLQLYRDSKDRYKQGQTKASLSLQHFLGVQSGFTLDKESNTIAIICQDVTVVLAFDTRERLIQWQVKIANNLGEDESFLVQISSAPLRAKLSPGPAMLHVLDYQFCLTVGVPPRLINQWQISQLRRYGVVESRFCFEGGSRCGKGEGLYVLVTDQGDDITRTFRLAAEGKLSTKRRPSSRSASDSPKKSSHGRAETRMSDVSCLDSLLQGAPTGDSQLTDDVLQGCECSRAGEEVLSWNISDQVPDFADASSVADCMETHPKEGTIWMGEPVMERCSSCISKLGALSRSSTAAMTPNSSFTPAWTMESRSTASKVESNKSQESCHQTHGCTQLSEVPTSKLHSSDDWNTQENQQLEDERCLSCPPARPPKPGHLSSQSKSSASSSPKKKVTNLQESSSCSCNITVNPYDNYDVPVPTKVPHVQTCQKGQNLHWIQNPMAAEPEYYDTPKHIMENCVSDFANYDIPLSSTIDKKQMCTSIKKNQYLARVIIDNEQMHMVPCPCQRMMCWPENWMFFPYCRRGNGRENTSPPLHKTNQGCGNQILLNNLSSVYATVDKTKKIKNRQCSTESDNFEKMITPSLKESSLNTKPSTRPTLERDKLATSGQEAIQVRHHIEGENSKKIPEQNYMNSDFLQSLELYENSKDFVQRSKEKPFKGQIHSKSLNSSNQIQNDSKICSKCKHECKGPLPNPDDRHQDDYLMMEPSATDRCVKKCNKTSASNCSRHIPGYLPMHPIGGTCVNNQDLIKSRVCQHLSERAVSSPSLIDHGSDRQRKLVDCETQRLPDSCLIGSLSATNSPYLRRRVLGCVHELTENDANSTVSRRRTSSADSKTNIHNIDVRTGKLQEPFDSFNVNITDKPSSCHKSGSKKSVDFDMTLSTNSIRDSNNAIEDSCLNSEPHETRDSGRYSSKYENIDWSKLDSSEPLVHKRSSSVPSRSSYNRDSLSSNDSGVSSCSLKKRMADFINDDQSSSSSSGRRYTYTRADSNSTSECFHYSLPRRSKSVDPLQDLAFQFQKVEVPTKSSSAEAEVPICHPKRESKGCLSPSSVVPYMDSRSNSSGTSDMSDYFETLSLSSYSSSDTPDSLHFGHQGVSTMRPRSGKEYQKIDRNLLDESKKSLLPSHIRENEKKESSS